MEVSDKFLSLTLWALFFIDQASLRPLVGVTTLERSSFVVYLDGRRGSLWGGRPIIMSSC